MDSDTNFITLPKNEYDNPILKSAEQRKKFPEKSYSGSFSLPL